MPKGRRRYIGDAKRGKSQILFSFEARDGEVWESDDSDEDYEPSSQSKKFNSASSCTDSNETEASHVSNKNRLLFNI